jgi:hypothetical protein
VPRRLGRVGADGWQSHLAWHDRPIEAKIRIRRGDHEIECTADEAFLADKLPALAAKLIAVLETGAVPEAPPEPPGDAPGVRIVGHVRDYWSGARLGGATVGTAGLDPELSAASDAAGRFELSGGAAVASGFLRVTRLSGHVDTTSGPVMFSGTQSPPALAQTDLNRQYAIVGRVQDPGTVFVVAHLQDAAGNPLESIPAADITLTTLDGQPVGEGPFFFGAAGDIQPQAVLQRSQGFDGRARAAFLNVPPGRLVLAVRTARTALDAAPGAVVTG